MTAPGCDRIALADLTDYAAGELPEAEAAGIEEHLFTCADCGARAAEFDALARAIRPGNAIRGGRRLRDRRRPESAGTRGRARADIHALARCHRPLRRVGGDELMALRLRADVGGASEFTLSLRVAGREVIRVTGHVPASPHGELIYAEPAARIRQLPPVEVEVLLTAHESGQERPIGSYTLVHAGSFHR